MKIANIVYEKELVNHTQLEFVNYINEPMEYDKIDKSLPTLYVGWSFMKFCNPNNLIIQNANILHKKIVANELYWEFSFEESKGSHIKGINNFINSAPNFYFNPKYQYVNLDPVFFQIVDIEDLLAITPKKIDIMYNYKNEMLYISSENKIWGMNLNMYEFFKFSIEEIISKISERAIVSHVDLEGITYQYYYKKFPNFTQLKRYMVVILK